jgi:hypothetical protein
VKIARCVAESVSLFTIRNVIRNKKTNLAKVLNGSPPRKFKFLVGKTITNIKVNLNNFSLFLIYLFIVSFSNARL